MTRSILVNFKMYTPYGKEFYQPILRHFLDTMEKYQDEFDTLYLLDSGWGITPEDLQGRSLKKVEHIDVNSSLRYYDVYKEVLPTIKEDLFLLMDNDFLIFKKGIVDKTFSQLQTYDVVSIMDTIGEYKTDKLKLGNKFCPYWFASKTELIKKYLDVEWGDHMPHSETLGLLTEAMVNDNIKIFEMEDDKTSFAEKDLGYFHVRAGSTPAYLLAEKHYGSPETYWSHLKNQPKSEYLRQLAFYGIIGGDTNEIRKDCGADENEWQNSVKKLEKIQED